MASIDHLDVGQIVDIEDLMKDLEFLHIEETDITKLEEDQDQEA